GDVLVLSVERELGLVVREGRLLPAGHEVTLCARAEVAVLRHLVAALASARRALEDAFLRVAILAADLGVLALDLEAHERLVVVERFRLPRQRRVTLRARPEVVVLALLGVAGGAGERRGREAELGMARQAGRRLMLAGQDAGAEVVHEGRRLPVAGVVAG